MSRFGSFFFVLLCVGWHKEGADGISCLTLLVRASHGECLQAIMFDMLLQTWKNITRTNYRKIFGIIQIRGRLVQARRNYVPKSHLFA